MCVKKRSTTKTGSRGLRDGRNYASDGKSHLIDFKVNGIEMGTNTDVTLAAPGTVRLTARIAARLDEKPNEVLRQKRLDQKPYWDVERARVGNTRTVAVEVIVNGVAVAKREIAADGELRNEAFDVPIERSAWVALRILPSSHTNPVWVTVAGHPIRSRKSAEWALKAVEQCWTQKVDRVRLSEQGEMKRAYDHARTEYQRLLAEGQDW